MIKEFIITQTLLGIFGMITSENISELLEHGIGMVVIAALFYFIVRPVVNAFTDNIKTTGEAINKLAERQSETTLEIRELRKDIEELKSK